MKQDIPLWLEREIVELDSLIELFQGLKSSIFSLASSPVDILTNLLVDLIMKIKQIGRAHV